MPEYKLYTLDGAGQIAGAPEWLQAADDATAIAAAEALQLAATVELWRGARLVKRLNPRRG